MAQYRSNKVSSGSESSVLTRRKIQARRALNSTRRVFHTAAYPRSRVSVASSASSPPSSSRKVLVPLHFNLRRLPSRVFSGRTDQSMRDVVSVGSKRKRVSGSENTQSSGRSSRAGGRAKRFRMSRDSSDEESSAMEIDDRDRWNTSDGSDDDGTLDSSDNHLINEASPKHLMRLRKDELVRLYHAAALTGDPETFTKPEIVQALVASRDDVASLPPSSPPGAESNSSDYSSDGGNVAGGEETDFNHRLRNGLKRRATVHELGRAPLRQGPDRSFSVNEIERRDQHYNKPKIMARTATQPLPRRRGMSNASSSRSSPTSIVSPALPSSPPATRLRSRKVSGETTATVSSKGKCKAKQVEFDDNVHVEPDDLDESDLTDLTEVESSINVRRLRSKDGKDKINSKKAPIEVSLQEEACKRVTPMRKARPKRGSFKDPDTEEDEEDELEESEDEGAATELPSPSNTPKASTLDPRTPLRRRLRSRKIETLNLASDGDDERSDDESIDIEESVDGDEEEGDEEEEGVEEEGDEDDVEAAEEDTLREASEEEVEEETLASQPRTLRSGKVVGEEIAEQLEEDDEAESVEDAASVDLDAEGSSDGAEEVEVEDDEPMEDDVDLTIATQKTLVRLRRDDLVRLCQTRDLETSGTKPQLADALLQWRDKHSSEFPSSPSSTGTARPPSTARPRGRRYRTRSNSKTPPVLMRSGRVHIDEPRTPPLSSQAKEAEPELELDLGSLGLEDREIPSEKLTKLEKIGSGGFKDVFIGKFKGRKVALAEFRGQLNAMDIKELKLLGDFDHPNIVRFLGVSVPDKTDKNQNTPVMIVSELCSNGDLFDYIRNVPPPTLYKVLCIMLDVARGLEYLHTRKPAVIHRDCKSSNILITSKGTAKITDFGLAKVKQSTRSMMRSLVGTVNWQAPELWSAHPKYNHKVDTFSLGMVFWEILQWHLPNKKYPWEGMNEHAIYEIVGAKHQRPSIAGLRKHWCPEIVDLVERMWAQEHQDRPSMTEVVHELERLVQKYR